MGWAAGSALGDDLWGAVREYIPEEKRTELAQYFYDEVCDLDADDWSGDSQLEIDAKVPIDCWKCDESTTADNLEGGLCKNCKEE